MLYYSQKLAGYGGVFMDKQIVEAQDTNAVTTTERKNEIGLPLIALGMSFFPVLLFFMNIFGLEVTLPSVLLPFVIMLPLAGLITGTVSLSRGKERIGIAGKIIAIIAVALPLALIACIIVIFIGLATGLISLM
jgi:hypothetical protein